MSLFGALALHSSAAWADKTEDDIKRAEQLFNEARAAAKANDYVTACPKFEASLKLARRAGTLFNLAQCEEHEGRLVSAVRYYKEGIVVLEPGDTRLAPSKKRLAAIEPRIPYLTINVASALPPGGRVTIDGREVEAIGKEFPVDPGKHEIRVLVPKHEDSSTAIDLKESVRETITVKAGERIPEVPVPQPVLGPRRIAGIMTLGLGAFGFITAGITGGLIISAKNATEQGCPRPVCTTAEGYAAASQGKSLLIGNTIAWGVGIVGAGVGTFLLLKGTKNEAAKPKNAQSLVLGPGFVGIEGSF